MDPMDPMAMMVFFIYNNDSLPLSYGYPMMVFHYLYDSLPLSYDGLPLSIIMMVFLYLYDGLPLSI